MIKFQDVNGKRKNSVIRLTAFNEKGGTSQSYSNLFVLIKEGAIPPIRHQHNYFICTPSLNNLCMQ